MTTYRINPGDDTLAACAKLKDGDTLQVGPGHYVNARLGIKRNDITVEGIRDADGNRPVFEAVSLGLNAKGKPMLPPDFSGAGWGGSWTGRGICVVKGKRVTIRGIRFTGAKSNSFNGAGIRHEGQDLFVYDCELDHNENGILGSEKDDPNTPDTYEGGIVWFQGNHFHHNGYGDGQAHNWYIGRADVFVAYDNLSEAALFGHLGKSRARTTLIFQNKFSDGDGNPSYHLDIDGGDAIVAENDFEKTPNAENPKCIIHYYLWHDNGANRLRVLRNRMKCLIEDDGYFVFADERIETKVNGKTVYAGTGIIDGKIGGNVCIFSPRMNGKNTLPYPHTYGTKPWRVPDGVADAGDNVVAPFGKEPPAKVQIVLTPATLNEFIAQIAA